MKVFYNSVTYILNYATLYAHGVVVNVQKYRNEAS